MLSNTYSQIIHQTDIRVAMAHWLMVCNSKSPFNGIRIYYFCFHFIYNLYISLPDHILINMYCTLGKFITKFNAALKVHKTIIVKQNQYTITSFLYAHKTKHQYTKNHYLPLFSSPIIILYLNVSPQQNAEPTRHDNWQSTRDIIAMEKTFTLVKLRIILKGVLCIKYRVAANCANYLHSVITPPGCWWLPPAWHRGN